MTRRVEAKPVRPPPLRLLWQILTIGACRYVTRQLMEYFIDPCFATLTLNPEMSSALSETTTRSVRQVGILSRRIDPLPSIQQWSFTCAMVTQCPVFVYGVNARPRGRPFCCEHILRRLRAFPHPKVLAGRFGRLINEGAPSPSRKRATDNFRRSDILLACFLFPRHSI